MSYELVGWENSPSTKTAVGATNLKHMDNGIKDAHDFIDSLPEWLKEGGKPDYTAEEVGAYSKEQTIQLLYAKANAIITNAKGETIHTTDSANTPLVDMTPYGKSTQDGTPTIENPIEVVSHGDKGSIEYQILKMNLVKDIIYGSTGRKYYPLVKGGDLSRIKKGQTYTLSATMVADADTVCYANGACSLFKTKEFSLKSGTNRIEYTFVALADGIIDDTINIVNKGHSIDDGVVVTASDFMITLFDNTVYEEFDSQPITIITPNGLRGIPIGTTIPDAIKNSEIHMRGVWFDKVEQQYYISDTREYGRGKDVQRIVKYTYDDLSRFWTVSYGEKGYTNCTCSIPLRVVSGLKSMSTHFNYKYAYEANEEYFYMSGSSLFIFTDKIKSIDEFKAFFTEQIDKGTPFEAFGILETSIETDIPSEEMAQYNALMMNEPNTTILNDEGSYTEVEYVADTKLYIDNKFKELEANVTSAMAQLL